MSKARKRERELLLSALDSLQRTACQFWCCRGPGYPIQEGMVTCHKCWTQRSIERYLASKLARVA